MYFLFHDVKRNHSDFLTHRDLIRRIDYKDIVRTRKQKGERSSELTVWLPVGTPQPCVPAAAPRGFCPKEPRSHPGAAAFSASEMLTQTDQ